jgi:hypothetical protein
VAVKVMESDKWALQEASVSRRNLIFNSHANRCTKVDAYPGG